jgi:platelet-activating factor acetylhydrolase
LASYGIIVIAPDHRDSSAPISFVRATDITEAKDVPYKKMSHTPSPEVYNARDHQLRIRLWELGCIHDAIVKMDLGQCPKNLDPNSSSKGKRTEVTEMFQGKMDVHQSGSIVWAGHSFGATTMVQFMKSTYYRPSSDVKHPLFVPDRSSHLIKQITNSSVALLLDMWCLPLRSERSRWLWNKPMPCYDTTLSTSRPVGGQALVAVLSEVFYKWEGNLNDIKRTLLPSGPAPDESVQWSPFCFYASASAHLSQSDFGILFPWITSKVLKTKEPERLLRLNARAMLQTLRVNGFEIASPTPIDLETVETSQSEAKKGLNKSSETLIEEKVPVMHDSKILAGEARDWTRIEFGDGESDGDGESAMHVEDDYQTPGVELDEAEVLAGQTPGREKGENEALRVEMTSSKLRQVAAEAN